MAMRKLQREQMIASCTTIRDTCSETKSNERLRSRSGVDKSVLKKTQNRVRIRDIVIVMGSFEFKVGMGLRLVSSLGAKGIQPCKFFFAFYFFISKDMQ